MNDNPNELVFLPLGGVGEIGMNLALYGLGPPDERKWLMVDCGIGFAGPDQPGIDLIMPDIRYIIGERRNLAGIVITHAHEDHYGALSDLWPKLETSLYISPFAEGLLKAKFAYEGDLPDLPIQIVKGGDRCQIDEFEVEFISMSHSIPESMALAIRTPHGNVIHSGDWKFDKEPLVGQPNDVPRLHEIASEGIRALICDSTNAVREGVSPSESEVAENLKFIIAKAENRVAVTLFASNVARIQAVVSAAKANNREIVIVGRAMKRVIDVATELGYLSDRESFLDEKQYNSLPRNKVVALCTGSQGEKRAALARIAENAHRHVSLAPGDKVIFSARTIPGNEIEVGTIKNNLLNQGVEIITDSDALVHVSGHPRKGELEQLYKILKPELLIPVHGEALHLETQAAFAKKCGIKQVLTLRNGEIIRISPGEAEVVDSVPSGILVKDGDLLYSPEDAGTNERRQLSFSGCAIGVITINRKGKLVESPQIVLIGIPQKDQNDYFFEDIAIDGLEEAIKSIPEKKRSDLDLVSEAARRGMRSAISKRWGKKPISKIVIQMV